MLWNNNLKRDRNLNSKLVNSPNQRKVTTKQRAEWVSQMELMPVLEAKWAKIKALLPQGEAKQACKVAKKVKKWLLKQIKV